MPRSTELEEPFELTEEVLSKYHELNMQKKRLEKELSQVKKQIHYYLDETFGREQKGEVKRGEYKVQRVIRSTVRYDDEKTVTKLRELHLADFLIQRPDIEKLEAAIKIDLVKGEDFEDCKTHKLAQAITVKEVN